LVLEGGSSQNGRAGAKLATKKSAPKAKKVFLRMRNMDFPDSQKKLEKAGFAK
jgi:hypothetical protein